MNTAMNTAINTAINTATSSGEKFISELRRQDTPAVALQLAASSTPKGAEKAPEKPSKTMLDLGVDQALENLHTYVAEGDIVVGTLKLKGGARIAGMVSGDLICENGSAIVESTGSVEGSISASKRIVIAGAVGHGADSATREMICPGDIIILGTGKATGAAYYGNLVTYDGGMVEGRVAPYKNYARRD